MADGKAHQSKSTFRRECGVGINIKAKPDRIWDLLTSAADFPRWNSTVESVDGQIALGNMIQLKVKVAPGRVFKLKVSGWTPGQEMVWRDGAAPMFQGVRTYTLSPKGDGSTDFSMVEVLSGLMMPMIGGSLPDFGPSFETYAADLKREAESK